MQPPIPMLEALIAGLMYTHSISMPAHADRRASILCLMEGGEQEGWGAEEELLEADEDAIALAADEEMYELVCIDCSSQLRGRKNGERN